VFIAEIVKSRGHLLTAVDRKLVVRLQAHPAEAPFWYASELTRPLGLHQSAATRLAQRLGFAGYPQLRDAVRQDYLAGAGPSQRVLGRLERHADDEVLRSFVDDEIEALSALSQHVAQAEIDDVAARLTTAGTVYLYGQGNATILVDQLSRRLQRFGINPVALVGSKRDVAERVAGIGPADLLVAFAFRRLPSTLCPLIELTGIRGAHSVLITDTPPVDVPRTRPRRRRPARRHRRLPLAHRADGNRQRRGAHHGQDLPGHHPPHPGRPGRHPRLFRGLTTLFPAFRSLPVP
jgi:DNA-binding MurR/RpiR family transcriptional regulator